MEENNKFTEQHARALEVLTFVSAQDLWAEVVAAKLGIDVKDAEGLILDLEEQGSYNIMYPKRWYSVSDWYLREKGQKLLDRYGLGKKLNSA
ncbi:MAG: hypothetical protein JO170_20825 [Verrucomicrobia bacterium]|jgi:hypothetical protein|nr:hypothetical protein [Verrucomicrobiota bacterium]